MKNIVLKISLLTLAFNAFTSCSEPEPAMAPFKPLVYSQDFEEQPYGTGSTEIPIAIAGWSNYNLLGTRLWICKQFNDSNYAEFSSFYSNAATSPNDQVWMITSKLDFSNITNQTLRFNSKTRYSNGATLKVLVSTDFDGTQAGISTATWNELSPILPTTDDVFTNSGDLDLTSFTGNNVYIAFKYEGSKQSNKTTTFQVDDIKIFENK